MYKILILPGGGVFGYIQATFLASRKASDLKSIRAMGGTSVGSIAALCLAEDMEPVVYKKYFEKMAFDIFKGPSWYNPRKYNPLKCPDYYGEDKIKSLKSVLRKSYNDLTLPVIVPTVDFLRGQPKIFDNIVADADMKYATWEIANMSSAAYTYFPLYKGHGDGGIIANSPTLVTVTALANKLHLPLSEMAVFVLGTGHFADKPYKESTVDGWSKLGWLSPLVSYLTKGNERMDDFYARNIGLGYYKLFNPVLLDKDWDMDDPDLLTDMSVRADAYSEEFRQEFETFINL